MAAGWTLRIWITIHASRAECTQMVVRSLPLLRRTSRRYTLRLRRSSKRKECLSALAKLKRPYIEHGSMPLSGLIQKSFMLTEPRSRRPRPSSNSANEKRDEELNLRLTFGSATLTQRGTYLRRSSFVTGAYRSSSESDYTRVWSRAGYLALRRLSP